MRFKCKKFVIISILILIIFIDIFYFFNIRFTSSSAAKANIYFEKNSILISEFKYGSRHAYMYKHGEKYFIITTKKCGPFWVTLSCISSNDVNDLSDNVRFIGWLSDKNITVYSILNKDPNVSYIEVESLFKRNRIRKNVKLNVPVHFIWKDRIRCCDLKAIAFSKNGKQLYKFGYIDKNNTMHYRWCRI